MNFKKIYLILITLVFSLSVFSQYQVVIGIKNYTPDGAYKCTGYIYNTVTLATQFYQFNCTAGPSGGGLITISVNDPNWDLKDLRVTHQSNNFPVANFALNLPGIPLLIATGVPVYRPSAGDNKVSHKWHNDFDGDKEWQYIITIL